MVDLRIDLCIFNGLGYIFDADHLVGLSCYEVGNGSSASIEIVN